MNELALFAGAGGGILGGLLLGWRTRCAVEIDPYCRRVLLARQRDGHLPRFPIWDDVTTFDGKPWRGRIDVVSGGFPCQPFSSAARGRNNAIDLWPEMDRIIGEVEPRHVFVENVQRVPIEQAAIDLAIRGYSVRFAKLRAAAVGAPHPRDRWWLAAHTNGNRERRLTQHVEVAESPSVEALDVWREDYTEPVGIHDGVANRMDRLRALGNGQVPQVAALAWSILATPDQAGCEGGDDG